MSKSKWRALLLLAQSGDAEAQWEMGYCHEFGAVNKSGTVHARVDLLEAKPLALEAQKSQSAIFGTCWSLQMQMMTTNKPMKS